jgi:exopolysaccharide production protein ExoZ
MSNSATDTASKTQRLEWVEVGRGLAALSVAMLHGASGMRLPQYSGKEGLNGIFTYGFLGVDFFFVLSGFIIVYSCYTGFGKPLELRNYALRRFIRVFPTYWLVLTGALIGNQLVQRDKAPISAYWLLEQYSLLLKAGEPWLGPAWSLQHEFMFYALLATFFFSFKFGFLTLSLWLIGIVLYHFQFSLEAISTSWINVAFHLYGLHFLCGAFLGFLMRKDKGLTLPTIVLVALGLVGLYLMYQQSMTFRSVSLLRYGTAAVGFAGIMGGLLILSKNFPKAPTSLVWLGSISYSLYLVHLYPISYLYAILSRLNWYSRLPEWLIFTVGLAAALLVAHLIFKYFETPTIAWARRKEKIWFKS